MPYLMTNGPIMAPTNPAIMTKTAVKGGMPPIVSLTCIPTGVVNDLGKAVSIQLDVTPIHFSNTKMVTKPVIMPIKSPDKIEYLYFIIMAR
ncbi:hypothetical protein D3C79_979520 [compost metagenome]